MELKVDVATRGQGTQGRVLDVPREQLIERIIASSTFQKCGRLRDLLRYLSDQSIYGSGTQLAERQVGQAVFGKAADYSPTEDSSVRVHVRQLRLKLHEYFDKEGRNEPLIVEVAKGSYTLVFRNVASGSSASEPESQLKRLVSGRMIPWLFCCALLALVGYLLRSRTEAAPPTPAPWPLAGVLQRDQRTQIVLADPSYSIFRIMEPDAISAEDYFKQGFQSLHALPHQTERESRLVDHLKSARLSSYADAVVLSSILSLAGGNYPIFVRSARDIRLRDLREGNYVFIGSPTSNPWMSLFENRLNFQEVQTGDGTSIRTKHFSNKQPHPNEQNTYTGLSATGRTGQDYATVALLAGETKNGNILIFQGLRGESTEAAGLFLADEANRRQLKKALGISETSREIPYFEALLRVDVISGSPNSTTIVATRTMR